MKLTFAIESTKFPKPNPFPFVIFLPKSENGWGLQGRTHKTAESWIDNVRKLLLSVGINDVDYRPSPIKDNRTTAHAFHFYFKTELECLQFQALTLENTKGKFTQNFSAKTENDAYQLALNVRKFLIGNEIPFELIWTENEKFQITTKERHHDLALAIQYAKGSFSREQKEDAYNSRVPALFLK